MALRLYNYFRSSASYRVRIALHLKGFQFDYIPVHLLKDGGQQNSAEHLQRNPIAQVPTLDHDGKLISQSLAIMTYLDDLKETPRLFSKDPFARAKMFEACEVINSGIQPLHNLSVISELTKQFGATKEQKDTWTKHWIEKGLTAFEKIIPGGTYCMGNTVSAVDVCLIAQLFSSRRFAADLTQFPKLLAIEETCLRLEAFQLAEPSRQIDAE